MTVTGAACLLCPLHAWLCAGLYPGSNDGAQTASSAPSDAPVASNTSAVMNNTGSGLQGADSGCQSLNSPESLSAEDSLRGGDECVVCSEELVAGAEVLWLPCTHVFHKG